MGHIVNSTPLLNVFLCAGQPSYDDIQHPDYIPSMVNEMTILLHVRNLSDTKEPSDTTEMQMNKESNLKELKKTIRN